MPTMKRRCLVLAGALAATFASGCATQSAAPPVAEEDKYYVTGSRIPRSDRASSGVKSTSDQSDIRSILRASPPGTSGN
jgi:hypothetical protein